MDISVVICTYNRAEMVRRALETLVRQDTRGEFSYEIIVVDDQSTDATPEVAAAVAADSPASVKYVRAEGLGVARARNRGVQEATGAWIAFTDDDQWNDPDWLYQLMAVARKTGAACVGGTVELDPQAAPQVQLTPLSETILGRKANPEKQIDRLMDSPGTGNVMFKREVFDTVGWFTDELVWGGEDADLMIRVHQAGFVVWFAPKSIVHHMIPAYRMTEKYFRWASLRVGVALAEVDCRRRGRARLTLLCLTRIGQGALVTLPQLLAARLTRNAGESLIRKCLWWRMTSYVRQTLYLLAPKCFPQDEFFAGLKFRSEQKVVATPKE